MDFKELFLKLLGTGMIGAACWNMFTAIRSKIKTSQSLDWPFVTGKIIRNDIVREAMMHNFENHNSIYKAAIEYEYEVNGKTYTGNTICIGGELDTSFKERAEERCEIYRVGSNHSVYFNPNKPEECCLEQTQEGAWLQYAISAGFLVLGTLILLGKIFR